MPTFIKEEWSAEKSRRDNEAAHIESTKDLKQFDSSIFIANTS